MGSGSLKVNSLSADEATGLALDSGHLGAAIISGSPLHLMFTPAPRDTLAGLRILKALLQESVRTLAPPPWFPATVL